jgi:carbonic anhydrase
MTKHRIGLSDNWLRHVQDVAARHEGELGKLDGEEARHRRLCELNAREQVQNIIQCTAVQEAWERGQPLEVHGWIYDLKDGLLRDLQVSHDGTR